MNLLQQNDGSNNITMYLDTYNRFTESKSQQFLLAAHQIFEIH